MLRRFSCRLIRAVGTAAVAVVAIVGLGLFLALGVLPRTGTYRTMTVLSGSMRPAIRPGSVVVVRRVDLHDIKVGDVISFQEPTDPDVTVTHRVVDVMRYGDRPLVRTKGDANPTADPWQAELGPDPGWRVVTAIPYIGRLIHAMQTPIGHRVVTLGIPAGFFIVWMWSVVRDSAATAGDPTVIPGLRARGSGVR